MRVINLRKMIMIVAPKMIPMLVILLVVVVRSLVRRRGMTPTPHRDSDAGLETMDL